MSRQTHQKTEVEIFNYPADYLSIQEIANPGGSRDAGRDSPGVGEQVLFWLLDEERGEGAVPFFS